MEKEELIALVQKAQAGDPAAVEELLRTAHTSVSYQCRKLLRNPRDAEDVTQEVLLTVYTKLNKLKNPATFWGWVNQITVNRCVDLLRRGNVEFQFAEDEEGHSVLDNLEEVDEQQVPDRALDNAETTRMIEEIVNSLPEAQRICVLMYYYDEMSVKDIAAALGVPENTVKSRLNYARKAVKEQVLDYEKEGVKLYGLSPLPFMLFFLLHAAEETADSAMADAMAKRAMALGTTAAARTGGAAAAGSSAAAKTAASAGGASGAAAAGEAVAAGAHAPGGLSVKLIAGALAGLLAVGGVAAAVTIAVRNADEPEPTPTPPAVTETVPLETATPEPTEKAPEETETPPMEDELIPADRMDLLYSFYWGRLNQSRMTVNQARAYAEVIERRTAEILPVDGTGVPVSYANLIDFGNGDPILLLTCGLDYGLTDPDSRMPTDYLFDGGLELWRYVDGRAELFAEAHEIHWRSDNALVLHTRLDKDAGYYSDFTEEVYPIEDGAVAWLPAASALVETDPNGVNSVDGQPVTPETMWPAWEQLWDRGGRTSIRAVDEWVMHDQLIHESWRTVELHAAASGVDHGSMDVIDFGGIWNSGLEAAGLLRQCAGEQAKKVF